ncbi:F-type H+-transporting ATPase subunit gamma [Ruminococcus sp. YE71]|uniref:ATP synthase F1 subunit gamma n=1 Tax=unclassified Ruminococcus TaxID=2608920 RepID=UPI0008859308|nr:MULTISPECIES: ATP synthase F1 subunit gamma [unclassified Ruminococcus]SDA12313.1 F-type H+-transporting ATPase subunit gamma [Ruminococcus sp. YE78]SFW16739.1 F-type H+-transporting ATPase subunit gamma [Ruminococcus sp. YE71]
MANMREIKERIISIKDIMKITNAMYLISSSKLKKARAALERTEPYSDSLQYTIHHILKHAEVAEHPFFDRGRNKPDDEKMYGYIVITGDKGLCGAYNHNILKLAEQELKKHKNNTLYVIGSVGRNYFLRTGQNVDAEFLYSAQDPKLYYARRIQETLTELFLAGRLDEVHVIYTDMQRNTEIPRTFKLLPLDREDFAEANSDEEDRHDIAVFEPSPEEVLDTLVPNYIKGVIFGALTESFCSEQNARMSAMDAATTSAKDMIAELTLDYNRARQAAITQEITEIVGGARAQKHT